MPANVHRAFWPHAGCAFVSSSFVGFRPIAVTLLRPVLGVGYAGQPVPACGTKIVEGLPGHSGPLPASVPIRGCPADAAASRPGVVSRGRGVLASPEPEKKRSASESPKECSASLPFGRRRWPRIATGQRAGRRARPVPSSPRGGPARSCVTSLFSFRGGRGPLLLGVRLAA